LLEEDFLSQSRFVKLPGEAAEMLSGSQFLPPRLIDPPNKLYPLISPIVCETMKYFLLSVTYKWKRE
jgi:hypothetical protein